jgi:hypothetical protein
MGFAEMWVIDSPAVGIQKGYYGERLIVDTCS